MKITAADVDRLVQMSISTFEDAFAAVNSPENMAMYIAEAFSKEKMLAEINNPESSFYFAYRDEEPVGYLKINTGKAQSDLVGNDNLEISRIYVDKTCQGLGIGQQMLDQAIQIARELGKDYVWLGVWEKNPGAIRFYERNGFVQISTHDFVLGTDRQTDLILKLIINK